MTLLSSNIKSNILLKINDIINIEDPDWSNLEIDLRFKIIHNLCNFFKLNCGKHINQCINQNINQNMNQYENQISNSINIPLKNQRPKKIIELCGINKQTNSELFDEYRKNIITINRDFRKTYNSQNKNYCFANLSNYKYQTILNNYNYTIYKFMYDNIKKIDSIKFFNNLIANNQHKIINSNSNKNKIDINKISYIDHFINIQFNNDVEVEFELYLTSEKITSNIPAKYKISLKNIF